MKKIYKYFTVLMLIAVLFSVIINLNTSSAQLIIPDEVKSRNNLNDNSTFFEIKRAMNEYWDSKNVKGGKFMDNGKLTKAAGWKIYKRWEYYWEQRVDQLTGEFPKTNSIYEYEKYLKNRNAEEGDNDYMTSWTNLGTNTSTGGYAGLGRINCVAFHPLDNNTIWVGSPSGGIWKTTNGGTNWNILNDNEQVLGVSDIAIPFDYGTSNTLYIATGDRDGGSSSTLGGGQGNDNNSVGVLKSTDGGVTWNTTGLTYSTSSKRLIHRLLIHPTNSSILLASTSQGIYKSTDAGATWTLKSISSSRFKDMQFNPADPSIIYCGRVAGNPTYVYKSTNTGETWVSKTVPVTVHYASQIRLAVSADNPAVVYVVCQDGQIYKSVNSGETYTQVNTNAGVNMLGYYTDGSDAGSQASYDLTLVASPSDANTVFLGSVTTWKSIDGGVTWTANTNWTSGLPYNISGVPEVHADKHILAYQNSTTLFEGNDGGIYKTVNGGSNWTDLSNGLVISQVYRIGVSQTNSSIVMTGLQDNGSKLFNTGVWSDVKGGDGMECIVDYSSTTYMYATYVEGQISRSVNNGISFPTNISANIPGGQPTGAWVTPYVISPSNNSTLFAGYDKVWKTTNRGDNWTSASQVLSSVDLLRSVAIAPSNSNILYAADPANMWKTTDGGATDWTPVSLPVTSNSITYIAVKNSDPSTLWITYGGYTAGEKVYESTDGGATWTNVSAGLPNLPVMCVVYDKTITDVNLLFVGTDAGVYMKDGPLNWASYSTGLPNVVVNELEIYYGNGIFEDILRAGTYGRGLWERTLESALPVELASFNSSLRGNDVILNWSTASETNNSGFDILRSTVNGQLSNDWIKIGNVTGNGTTNSQINYSFTDRNLTTGNYNYRLKQIDFNGNFEYFNLSNEVNVGIPVKFELSQNYPNPFNPSTTINYDIPKDGKVSLRLFDMSGKEVATLVNEVKTAGYYSVTFNAANLSSGVYFYSITANNFTAIKKMMLIK